MPESLHSSETAADTFFTEGMEKVVCIRSAKVPIVKIWDPELHLACDMNINNTLALENTRMVRTYVEIDERVRPLIMVVKYWTKMRVINEAGKPYSPARHANHRLTRTVTGVGGTYSSYTWICLIISFLQLRKPPVLPALHERQHQKLAPKNGKISAFADDLSQLRGFGSNNKESLGELLFAFFRFYAHEFEYERYTLSVRLGKMIAKEEKNWHISMNNRLAVEEPFTTDRNLGNTADDYSFKGVHEEIRKAFHLVGRAELEKIFEKYEFPTEEAAGDRSFFQKPDKSRPILVRSSSQTHGNRARGGFRGRGGFRHNARRASSSVAYDSQHQYPSPTVPIATHPQTLYHGQQTQPQQFYNDLLSTAMAVNTMRLLDYQHSQATYMAQQFQAWQAALQQGTQPSSDRPRADSFDNPPLSAPIRPELYAFPVPQQPYGTQPQQPGHNTHPSSPSGSSATPIECRRSLRRSAVLAESGNLANTRSQSQPAARSHPSAGYVPNSHPVNQPHYLTPRTPNGMPISFMLESEDQEMEDSMSPSEEDPRRCLSFQISESTSPANRNMSQQNDLPSFIDVGQAGQNLRRLSTDQLPQNTLEKRIRCTSRSPSPLGHNRAFSIGTNSAPLKSAPFPPSCSKLAAPESSPLIVNGSSVRAASGVSACWLPMTNEGQRCGDTAFDNPLCISQSQSPQNQSPVRLSTPPTQKAESSVPLAERPLVVNGTTPSAPVAPLHNVRSYFPQFQMVPPFTCPVHTMSGAEALSESPHGLQTTRQRVMPRQQQVNGMVAHLDLAVGDGGATSSETQSQQHLSPVYEVRSPSPKVARKFEPTLMNGQGSSHGALVGKSSGSGGRGNSHRNSNDHLPKKTECQGTSGQRVNGSQPKESSHGRSSKADSDNHMPGQWQKAKTRRRGGEKNQSQLASQGERKPVKDDDRKGG